MFGARPLRQGLLCKLAAGFALVATPAFAERFVCVMEDGRTVDFRVDPALFVDAISAEEPIRRMVTRVQMGSARFPAEPFKIGELRGFAAESSGGGTVMFVVGETGSARLSDPRNGVELSGICEVGQ